jgi:hypothetical protein
MTSTLHQDPRCRLPSSPCTLSNHTTKTWPFSSFTCSAWRRVPGSWNKILQIRWLPAWVWRCWSRDRTPRVELGEGANGIQAPYGYKVCTGIDHFSAHELSINAHEQIHTLTTPQCSSIFTRRNANTINKDSLTNDGYLVLSTSLRQHKSLLIQPVTCQTGVLDSSPRC